MRRNQIILLVVAVFALVSVIYYMNLLSFRITSVTPKDSRLPTSAQNIIINFNNELGAEKNKSENIRVSTDLKQDVGFSEKSINIRLKRTLELDEKLTIDLLIFAKNGKQINQRLVFTGVFIPPDEQPKELQDIGIENSNSFESYKLTAHLPVIAENYEIDYRFPDSSQSKMPIIITVKTSDIPRPRKDAPVTSTAYKEYTDRLREGRREAIAFLESTGSYDKDKYSLYFPEPYLLEEFNGQLFEK